MLGKDEDGDPMFLNLNEEPILETYFDPRVSIDTPSRSFSVRRPVSRMSRGGTQRESKFYPAADDQIRMVKSSPPAPSVTSLVTAP